jgi:hypothetical protein
MKEYLGDDMAVFLEFQDLERSVHDFSLSSLDAPDNGSEERLKRCATTGMTHFLRASTRPKRRILLFETGEQLMLRSYL